MRRCVATRALNRHLRPAAATEQVSITFRIIRSVLDRDPLGRADAGKACPAAAARRCARWHRGWRRILALVDAGVASDAARMARRHSRRFAVIAGPASAARSRRRSRSAKSCWTRWPCSYARRARRVAIFCHRHQRPAIAGVQGIISQLQEIFKAGRQVREAGRGDTERAEDDNPVRFVSRVCGASRGELGPREDATHIPAVSATATRNVRPMHLGPAPLPL